MAATSSGVSSLHASSSCGVGAAVGEGVGGADVFCAALLCPAGACACGVVGGVLHAATKAAHAIVAAIPRARRHSVERRRPTPCPLPRATQPSLDLERRAGCAGLYADLALVIGSLIKRAHEPYAHRGVPRAAGNRCLAYGMDTGPVTDTPPS
jgi:hypothetical protein